MAINYEDIFGAQPTAPQQSTKTYNLDDYLSFGKIEKEQTVNLDQALQELRGQLGSGQYKKSLNDLEQNREFQQIASDFLRSIGDKGDDIFEYMRDEDFNLTKGFTRWADATNFSEVNKKRYAYLRTAFDNASIGGFGQGMELVKDAAIDIVSDPANIVGVLAGIFTGGTATAASFAARQSTAQALKASLRSIGKSSIKPTPTNLRATGQQFGQLLKLDDDAAKLLGTATMLSTYEGLAHIGLGDVARQGTQIATDIKESYNPLQTAAMVPVGTTLGQAFPLALTGTGKAVGAISKPIINKASEVIGIEKYQQKLLNDYKQKINNYENEDFVRPEVSDKNFQFQRTLSRLVGNDLGFLTFARATAPLRGLAKQSPVAKKLLLKLKKDEAQKYLDLPELEKGLDFGSIIENQRGLVRQKFFEIISPIFEVDESIFSRKFLLSPDKNEQLLQALLGKKTYGTNKTKIDKTILDVAKQLRKLDNDIYADARDAGLRVPYLKKHFPRFFNRETLIEKKNIFINELKTSGQVAPVLDDFVREIEARPDLADNLLVPFLSQKTGDKQLRKLSDFYDIKDGNITYKEGLSDEVFKDFRVHLKQNYKGIVADIENRKANQVYNDMVDMANVDLTYASRISGGRGNFTGRAFDKISDDFLIENGFIEGDVINAFTNYFNRAIPIIVRTKELGYNLDDFQQKFVNQIQDELQYKLDRKGNILRDDKGIPIQRENPLTLSEKDRKYLNDLYMYTTGKGLSGKGFIAEQVVPHLQFLNATAYLPLATVSSLTELALPFTRANLSQYAGEVGRPVKELTENMVDKTKVMFNQSVDNLRKLGLDDDEIYRELRIFGLTADQTARERAVSLSGEGLIETKFLGKGPEIYKLQDAFYKYNLLRDWTASVERTAYLIGKRIINDNVKKLALNQQLTSDFVPSIQSFKFTKGQDAGGWAKYDRNENTIFIDEDELVARFNDKAWTKPKVAGVQALPEDSFKSLDEFRTFIVNHEKNHAKFRKLQDESLADYENRINRLALEETQYKPLSAKEELRLREQLVELGINPDEGIRWYTQGAIKYDKVNKNTRSYDILSDGRKYSTFYNDLMKGATRFTNEVILNPSSASALKPMLYNHPQAKILFQFLSYPSAFSNTVLKKGIQRATRSMARGDLNSPAKLFGTFALMTTSAMYLNNARTSGKEFEKDPDEVFINGISRTGITGVFDTVDRVASNIQYGGRGVPVVLAKAIGGPMVSDAIELFQFNRGIAETFSRKIPVVNQILRTGIIPEGENIPKLLQEAARDLDQAAFDVLESAFVEIGLVPEKIGKEARLGTTFVEAPRVGKEKGGLVFNVPQVPVEPEDRKVRGRPFTFKEAAGFIVEDEEDRVGFVSGGTVAIKGFSNFLNRFIRSKLPSAKHTELQHIYEEQNKNLEKIFNIRTDESAIRSYRDSEVDRVAPMSQVKDDVYLSYSGNDIKDVLTDKFFNKDNLGIKLTSSPVGTSHAVKIHTKNLLDIKDTSPITMDNVTRSPKLKDELTAKIKERSHEFGNFEQDFNGLIKDYKRVKQKILDDDLTMDDRKIVMSYYNTKLFNLLEQAGFDAVKQQDNYFVPHVRNMVFRRNKAVEKVKSPEAIGFALLDQSSLLSKEYQRLLDSWLVNQSFKTKVEYNNFWNNIYKTEIGELDVSELRNQQPWFKKFIKDVPQAKRIDDQSDRLMEESIDYTLDMTNLTPISSRITDITMAPKLVRQRAIERQIDTDDAIIMLDRMLNKLDDLSPTSKPTRILRDKQIDEAYNKLLKKGYNENEANQLIWNVRKAMNSINLMSLNKYDLSINAKNSPALEELRGVLYGPSTEKKYTAWDVMTAHERRLYEFDEDFNIKKNADGGLIYKPLEEYISTSDRSVLNINEQKGYTFDEDGYITGMWVGGGPKRNPKTGMPLRDKDNNIIFKPKKLMDYKSIKSFEDLDPKNLTPEQIQKYEDDIVDNETFMRKTGLNKLFTTLPDGSKTRFELERLANRSDLQKYVDEVFDYDLKPEQAQLTKKAMQLLNNKDASFESMNKLRGDIISLAKIAYDKWFYRLPSAMQRDLTELDKKGRYDINTSEAVGEGQTTPESLEIVKPNTYVLKFYELNPEIQKLDDLSGRLLAKMYEMNDKNSGI